MSTTATPSRRPAAPPRAQHALRLHPPHPGDYLALAACAISAFLFIAVGAYLWKRKLIQPESPLLWWLAIGSIVLALAGLAWSLAYDVRRLRRDERAIQFLLDADVAADPLFDLAREPALGAGTLAGDLARRVDQARPGGRAPTPAELRGIAGAYTASLGGVARFVSQLLLLLTVLGTFLGVREALPKLIRTLGDSTGAGSLSTETLTKALTAVGDAFGSNLGALLGSIALGIAAYGLGAGRQAMLARLELASVQHVYPALERRSAVNADSEMIRELRTATENLASLAGLTDAMRDLQGAVAGSSDRTAQLLERALRQEREIVLQDTREQVSQLEGLVTEVATAVLTNATDYATIAQALASRDREFGAAVREIRTVAEKLQEVSESHGANVRGMASDLLASLTQMEITLRQAVAVSGGVRQDIAGAREDLQALIGGATEVGAALVTAQTTADRAREEAAERERTVLAALRDEQTRALAAADAHQRETLDRVETEMVRLLAERITPSVGELRSSVDSLRGVVDGVRGGTEAGVLEAFRRAREERTGGGVDDLASVLERISALVEQLDAPADDLVAALENLAEQMERADQRMMQSIWRRLPQLIGREPSPRPSAPGPRAPRRPPRGDGSSWSAARAPEPAPAGFASERRPDGNGTGSAPQGPPEGTVAVASGPAPGWTGEASVASAANAPGVDVIAEDTAPDATEAQATAPTESTPEVAGLDDAAPTESAPEVASLEEGRPAESTLEAAAPTESVTEESASVDATLAQGASTESASEEGTLADGASAKSTSGEAGLDYAASTESAPEVDSLDDTASTESAPEAASLEEGRPAEFTLEAAVPTESVMEESASVNATLAQGASAESTSEEGTLADGASAEATSGEARLDDTASTESAPEVASLEEGRPAESASEDRLDHAASTESPLEEAASSDSTSEEAGLEDTPSTESVSGTDSPEEGVPEPVRSPAAEEAPEMAVAATGQPREDSAPEPPEDDSGEAIDGAGTTPADAEREP
jgi:uncharacterized protein YukE